MKNKLYGGKTLEELEELCNKYSYRETICEDSIILKNFVNNAIPDLIQEIKQLKRLTEELGKTAMKHHSRGLIT